MATPAFTGVDYLSALSEFPGGPQGLIDAAVERFGAQGLTATPRGDDFSLYVPGEFMSSGRPMNYASTLADPTVGGGYYDYLYSTPAFKDIYTNILSPTLTGLQQAPQQTLEQTGYASRPNYGATRPIAKAGAGQRGGATGSPAATQLPGLQVTSPVGQTVTETPEKQLELPQITESASGLQGTPVETTTTPTAPTPIDTRTPEEIQMDKGLDVVNKLFGSDLTGKTYFERPTYPERDPYATEAVDTRPLGIYRTGEPTRGLVIDMPLESRYPESTGQQYLKGGLDAFSFSGPQGYADVRQQLLGEPADAFTGDPVPWHNLGKEIDEDLQTIYLGTGFPDISVDDILANIPKIDLSDYNAAKDRRLREFIADVPEGAFWQNPDPWEFSDETMSGGLRGAIADLVSDRATEAGDTVFVEAREGIEGTEDPFDYVRDDVSVLEQWLGIRFTDAEKQAMTGAGDAEDFRFYEHPGVRKKFSDGLDTLNEAADLVRKGLFGETPYGPEEQNKQPLDRVTARVRSLGNTLAELNSEVSTLIELEGDTRKSIGTYDPKFPTLKGLLQLATGQGLSEVDKQKYGSLNVGALATLATIAATAPQATAAVLGLQITNTLRKIAPQILNVATFKEADYSGGLFSDVVEFSGEVMRPIGRFFVENIFQKINENAPDDANLRSQFESLFEGDKPQTFAEYLEPEATVVVNRPDFPSVDPTGQITPPGTGVPFSASPASGQNVTGQVTSRPGTETPIRSSDPNKEGYKIDYTPSTTTPSRTTLKGRGVGVGGGIGGSRPTTPIETRDAITLDIAPSVAEGLTPPLNRPLPAGEPVITTNTDAFGRDIATLDALTFVPEVDRRPRLGATTGTTPFGGLTRAFTPLTTEAAEIEDLDIFTGVPDPSTLPTDLGGDETVDIKIADDLFKPPARDVIEFDPGTEEPSESLPTDDDISGDWDKVLENLPEDVKEVRTIPMKEFEFDAEGRLIETGRVLNVPQRLELVASENADGSVTYGYRYQDYDQSVVNYLIQAKQTNVVDANVNYSSHVRKDGELLGYNAKSGDKVYTIPEDLEYEDYKTIQMPSGETPSDFVEPPYLSVDEINTQATELSSNLTKAAKNTLGDVLDVWPKAQTRSPKSGRLYSEIIKDQYDTLIASGKSPSEALSITLAVSRQYAPASLRYGANYTKEFTDELEEKLSGSFSDVMYGTRELDNLNIGAIANFNYQPVVINAALRNLKLPEFDFGDKLNIVSRLKDYQPGGYQRIADNVGLDNPFKIPDLNVQIDSGGGVQITAPGP